MIEAQQFRARGVVLILLVMSGLIYLGNVLRYRGYLLDDAFISLRYARNLAEGHGLVFNVGERVEGYTNLFWVLIASFFMKIGAPAVAALKIVSVLAATATLLVVQKTQRIGGNTGLVPAAVWLLSLQAWGYWSVTTMETMLFTAVFAWAVHLSLREGCEGRRMGSLPVFMLLALIRPEGALCFGLCHLAVLQDERWRHGSWTIRRHAVDGALFATFVLSHLVGRFIYYGTFLPNTYQAKVTGGPEQWLAGIASIGKWARAEPIFAIALLVWMLLWATPGLRRAFLGSAEGRVCGAIALGYAAYAVAIGGDFMPFHRFFVPILPLCALLCGCLVAAAAKRLGLSSGGELAVTASLVAIQAIVGMTGDQSFVAFRSYRSTVVGQRVGRFLAESLGAHDLIAVNAVGAVAYESRLPTLDMLGLNDRMIALHPSYVVTPGWAGHRRGWGDYVLSRLPRVLFWYNTSGSDEPFYLGDRQLADNPFFRFFYQLRRVELPASRAPAAGSETGDGLMLARFFGKAPAFFRDASSGVTDSGFRVESPDTPFGVTRVFETPVSVYFFELRADRVALWPLREKSGGDPERFLQSVLEVWRSDTATPSDPAARREVEALCREARERIDAGESSQAKAILERALPLNAAARTPLVYQYIANLAVLEGSAVLAVQAQSEALRLAPDNPLYRTNLLHLLTTPYQTLRAGRKRETPAIPVR